jgi:hypothetical protein
MSKKRKALQVSALLSAMGGATLLVAAGSVSVQAAETNRVDERCWDQQKTAPTTNFRLHGCSYGLVPKGDGGADKGKTPTDSGIPPGGGSGGPSSGPGYVS